MNKPVRRSKTMPPNKHKRARIRAAELDRLNQAADELNAEAEDVLQYQVPIESIFEREDA